MDFVILGLTGRAGVQGESGTLRSHILGSPHHFISGGGRIHPDREARRSATPTSRGIETNGSQIQVTHIASDCKGERKKAAVCKGICGGGMPIGFHTKNRCCGVTSAEIIDTKVKQACATGQAPAASAVHGIRGGRRGYGHVVTQENRRIGG